MKGTVIEKEGRFYKECGVVMLEGKNINQIGDICLFFYGLNIAGKEDMGYPVQHLYITSDDEIKEGDWLMSIKGENLRQCTGVQENQYLIVGDNNGVLKSACKKVIATTDTSLTKTSFKVFKNLKSHQLPQPSDKFIQAYIDAYNKGEKIEKVLAECEELYASGVVDPGYVPKLIIKDNTIIIKKVKDSWECNRSQLLKLTHDVADALNGEDSIGFDLEKWIEENL